MGNKIKSKQITSGNAQLRNVLLADGSGNTFFDNADVGHGNNFPLSNLYEGQLYFRDDLKLLFQYDILRTKWLSVERQSYVCGRNSLSDSVGGYLGIADTLFTSTEGILMPLNGTIISVSADNANVITRNIEFRVNNSTINRIILPLTSSKSNYSTTSNIDFSASDLIQVYSPATTNNSLNKITAVFEVAWRE